LCEVLYLAKYIEKYGTGTLMMIHESLAHLLPEPDFVQRGSEFTITLWRDWLTASVVRDLDLNERQLMVISRVRQLSNISTRDYQRITGASRPTAKRDLEEMVKKAILVPKGLGRGAHYEFVKKRLINDSNGSANGNDLNGS